MRGSYEDYCLTKINPLTSVKENLLYDEHGVIALSALDYNSSGFILF